MCSDDPARSDHPCPACGERRLTVQAPPRLDVMGVQAYGELLGMGDLHPAPAIFCLSCQTRWSDAEAFRLDQRESEPGPP